MDRKQWLNLAAIVLVAFCAGCVTDRTAPEVTDCSPADGATGVMLNTSIQLTFSEDMEESSVEVHTRPHDLEAVRKALEEQGISVSSAELLQVPKNMVSLDEKSALQSLKLLEKLEEMDDIQHVFTNADFPDAVVKAYQG